jgi:hypothetical protein
MSVPLRKVLHIRGVRGNRGQFERGIGA